ncbi:putative filamin-A isoform X1 [Penaeus vannamei]|uniref:Putative filamin-A isoform X1 n=1 Tax=Penaeus vannamei TaxID=6689 RepID=A0A3R7PFN8_PENVA|nr:putative filamin-A isoform X1 [Penaeus vannamei]
MLALLHFVNSDCVLRESQYRTLVHFASKSKITPSSPADRPGSLGGPRVEAAALDGTPSHSSHISSVPKIPFAQSDGHFDIADSSHVNVSVGSKSSSAITTTTIRRSEENLISSADLSSPTRSLLRWFKGGYPFASSPRVPLGPKMAATGSIPSWLGPASVLVPVRPGKRHVPLALNQVAEGEVMAAFTPQQVGEYLVDVRVKDTRIPGSPFRCYVYDSQEIRVGTIPNGIVGRPVEFEIDGSTAGSGNLEILVNGGHVTSYVRNLGQQRFLASFVPHSAIRHMVEMRFNGEKVPGE